ncbi:MAG: selenocysteine-specific translation elongation factor [Anaerolineales bacterium]|nr:selenocysteine-specific translation elongation factor [Anaerolineales bacterium]
MYVIGTAGHVDHGKSELVRILTGTHPDRLPEEQARQMTIDLGFAWVNLPLSGTVGIVDVPGHRDFIENMLSGVGMIDAVLFVVAADEGIMPQTREHLAILSLLELQHAVIVLTKVDLVDDPEWLLLVENDIQQILEGTSLQDAPIVRTSAPRGEGIEELKNMLDRILQSVSPRLDKGRPRLHLDRIFSLTGFGTVVTGTLIDGCLKTGCEVELSPHGKQGRIRNLQSHQEMIETAYPGSRVAVNLGGINRDQISRGDTLILPESYESTSVLDVSIDVLADVGKPLKHNQELKFFLGAAQCMARLRLLGADQIEPGQSGFAQLVLDHPVTAARKDHYIIRQASPPQTIGGGRVLDTQPSKKHRRYDANVIHRLEQYSHGPEEIMLETVRQHGPNMRHELIERSGIKPAEADILLDRLIAENEILALTREERASIDKSILLTLEAWRTIVRSLTDSLQAYHASFPLRVGMPRQELRSRLKLPSFIQDAVIERAESEGLIDRLGSQTRLKGFSPRLSTRDSFALEQLAARFDASPTAPPTIKACIQEVGEELFFFAIQRGDYIRVSDEIVFSQGIYSLFIAHVREILNTAGEITVKDFRDRFNSSRKYAIAFLEHLNQRKWTALDNDRHILLVPVDEWELPCLD